MSVCLCVGVSVCVHVYTGCEYLSVWMSVCLCVGVSVSMCIRDVRVSKCVNECVSACACVRMFVSVHEYI